MVLSSPGSIRPLSILLISDDRPGHYHLSEGVIAAVARSRPVTTSRLSMRMRRWTPARVLAKGLATGMAPTQILTLGYGLRANALPRPELIVSAGGETLIANAALARLSGAANVFCGTLRHLPPEAFSLVISSYARHAHLPRHLVALKPNGIDPDTLQRDKDQPWLGRHAPPQLAGLLIGGDSGTFKYQPAEWEALLAFLRASQAAHGTRWIVSTSRRSPLKLGDRLAAIAEEVGGPIDELIDFHKCGPGTLPSVFARAQVILCTEDSSTMMSEAVCAQLPVVGVSPAQHGFKDEEREYRSFMRSRGWCRFLPLRELTPDRFLAELAAIEPLRENHLDQLSAALRRHLPQLFA